MPSFNFSEKPVLICKDHTVSGRFFELRKEEDFQFLATFPKPDSNELPEYYKSEKYISHTDSKRTIFDKTYHGVKKFMLQRKMSWIETRKGAQGKLLDIGAGTGDFLLAAKNRGWEVNGQEPNPAARNRARSKGIILEENVSHLPTESYDVITLWHVLEHVPNLEDQIRELDRLLTREGLLIIAVPNFKSYDAQVYRESWAAYDVPRHLYHFSRPSIKKLFSKFSFELVDEKGLLFDAFYVSLLSEKIRKGKSNFANAFFTGALSNLRAKFTGEYSSLVYFLEKRKE
jgi:ubiquinone/menaquinone biosynthesis C-methylase UbiE